MKTLVMNRLSRLMSKYFELYYIFRDRARPKVSFVIRSDSENYLYDHDSIDYSKRISINLQFEQIAYIGFISNQQKIEVYRNPPKFMIQKSNFEC